jgi:enamine deaminase RidA (YjgF/YER057c/UK114 family)
VTREQKLEKLGFPIDRVPPPAALYRPVVVHGLTAYVSGCIPLDGPGFPVTVGKVGSEVGLEEAKRAAALCAANILRLLKVELGDLGRIERVVRLGGYVCSAEGFTDQHLVLNGASELIIEVLGEAGQHSRAAVGVSDLPLGSSVEVDAIVALLDGSSPDF